jgi:hypothetical protein
MSEDNFWGDIPIAENIKTPRSILKEQISHLEQGTNGLLTGKLTISTDTDGDLRTAMLIIAPALNNYSYEVTELFHSIALYPLKIFHPGSKKWFLCENETQFKATLKDIFQSVTIKRIISGLLAQIKADSD